MLYPQPHSSIPLGAGSGLRGEEAEEHAEPHPQAAPVRQTPHLQRGRLAPASPPLSLGKQDEELENKSQVHPSVRHLAQFHSCTSSDGDGGERGEKQKGKSSKLTRHYSCVVHTGRGAELSSFLHEILFLTCFEAPQLLVKYILNNARLSSAITTVDGHGQLT